MSATWNTVFGIIWITISFITGCIGARFTSWLFYHLFKFDHNWIIEPDKRTKIFSFIASSLLSITSLLDVIIWIFYFSIFNRNPADRNLIILDYTRNALGNVGQYCYYLYLFFNIKCEMQQNQVINHAVSKTWTFLTSLIFLIGAIYYPVYQYLNIYFRDNYDSGDIYSAELQIFQIMTVVGSIASTLLYDFNLLYVYIRSMHIYGKWWYFQNWKESEKYGINQMEHQILIRITRFAVVCTIATMVDIIYSCLAVWYFLSLNPVSYLMVYLFDALMRLTKVSAIYFSHEFGYVSYLKVYGKLHQWIYEKFQRAHQHKAHNSYVRYQEM